MVWGASNCALHCFLLYSVTVFGAFLFILKLFDLEEALPPSIDKQGALPALGIDTMKQCRIPYGLFEQ